MATIVRGSVPASEFALAETLSTLSDVEVEIERIVASSENTVTPLLWVRGTDSNSVTAVLNDDPSVREVSLLSAFENEPEQLYQMEWISEIEFVIQLITTAMATITKAFGKGRNWYLQVLYPSRDALTATVDYCNANDLTYDIHSIYELEGEPSSRYGLTEIQHKALTAATEAGYYHVPRDVTMQELADELDVSHQALSERLRRAIDTLVTETVLMEPSLND